MLQFVHRLRSSVQHDQQVTKIHVCFFKLAVQGSCLAECAFRLLMLSFHLKNHV